jgi:hypothetical protein
MLPGNINGRIVTFANKDEGFDRQLFLKKGQKTGKKQKKDLDTNGHELLNNEGTKDGRPLREMHE